MTDIQLINFPFQLVVMIGVRKALDCVFTKAELKMLDDVLPEFKRQERIIEEEKEKQEEEKEKEQEKEKTEKDGILTILFDFDYI